MADIPPDISISSAQAGFVAKEVAKERSARDTGPIQSANRQVKSLDEASATVDTEDADTAVFTDAEGTGSQGRSAKEDADQPGSDENADDGQSGITRDAKGQLHLDLEA